MFIKKLMEKIANRETNDTTPTVDSMMAFFAYGAIRNIKATADPSLASRFEVEAWHDIIGEQTIADAILDRLVHTAHRIDIKGESMRKKLKNNY